MFQRRLVHPLCALTAAVAFAAPADAATIPVTTTADSSMSDDAACSLRAALAAANNDTAVGACPKGNGADTVQVPAGTYSLTNGELPLASNVTVEGAGTADTVIDGANASRVFNIADGFVVVLQRLTITHGHAPDGPAGASQTVTNPSSSATGGAGSNGQSGGGIFHRGGDLTLTEVAVIGNRAGDGGAGGSATAAQTGLTGLSGGNGTGGSAGRGGDGGGIASGGRLTLTRSTISGNRAGNGGRAGDALGGKGGDGDDATAGNGGPGGTGATASAGAGGNGGGVWHTGTDAVSVDESAIDHNDAGDAGAPGTANGGVGGVGGRGGGKGGDGGVASTGPGTAGGFGGGIYDESNSPASLNNSTIAANTAGDGGSSGNAAGGRGGNGGPGAFHGPGGNGGNGGQTQTGNGGPAGNGGAFRGTAIMDHDTVTGNTSGAAGQAGTAALSFGGDGGASGGGGASQGFPGAFGPPFPGNPGAAATRGALMTDTAIGLNHSIVSANSPINCDTPKVQDQGGNIAFPAGGCASSHADPLLGPLEDNGGPTMTMRLLAGSPARDSETSAACGWPTDQRGVPRPQNGACDHGAYEAATPAATTDPATTLTSIGATLNATVQSNSRQADVHFDFGTSPSYGATTLSQRAGGTLAPGGVSQTLIGLQPETTYHYRVVATTPDGTAVGEDQSFTTPATPLSPGGGPGPDLTPPALQTLTMGRAFRAAGSGSSVAAKRTPVGTTVKYTLSEPATVTFTVERATSGRRVGRRCVKPKRKNRKGRKCTRYVALKGSFTHAGKAGANSFKFTGRIGGKKLKPGKYQLVAVAADAAGNKSAPRRRAFKIVKR